MIYYEVLLKIRKFKTVFCYKYCSLLNLLDCHYELTKNTEMFKECYFLNVRPIRTNL